MRYSRCTYVLITIIIMMPIMALAVQAPIVQPDRKCPAEHAPATMAQKSLEEGLTTSIYTSGGGGSSRLNAMIHDSLHNVDRACQVMNSGGYNKLERIVEKVASSTDDERSKNLKNLIRRTIGILATICKEDARGRMVKLQQYVSSIPPRTRYVAWDDGNLTLLIVWGTTRDIISRVILAVAAGDTEERKNAMLKGLW